MSNKRLKGDDEYPDWDLYFDDLQSAIPILNKLKGKEFDCSLVYDELESKPALTLKCIEMIYGRIKLNYQRPARIKDLKSNLVGKYVTIKGTIVRVSGIKPIPTIFYFECPKCTKEFKIKCINGIYKSFKCQCKALIQPNRIKTKTIDHQLIKVQEMTNDGKDSGRVPRTVECELVADLVDTVVPGDVVSVSGIVKALSTNEAVAQMYQLYIEVNNVERVSDGILSKDLLEFSQKDLNGVLEIHNYGLDKSLFTLLVHSVCPSIYGHHLVKAGILLTLFGARKRLNEGNSLKMRSDPHILIVGDPGLGKSQLLSAAIKLAPRGVYVTGNTSTTAGLTVTVTKEQSGDGSEVGLEAGALVLGDRGITCIDEFDKMREHSGLLEAMEQQSISIAKAGIVCSLPTRTSIIAAANPIHGHYDKSKSVGINIGMKAALLSRFDLIFVMIDVPDAHGDKLLSDHILKIHGGSNERIIINNEAQQTDPTRNLYNSLNILPDANDLIPQSLLRKYISYARNHVQPRLSPEAADRLREYYAELRASSNSKISNTMDSTPVTTRQLESLIRLCEARARSELRETVTDADARDVIELFKYAMIDVEESQNQENSISGSRRPKRVSLNKEMKSFVEYLRGRRTGGFFLRSDLKDYASEMKLKNDFSTILESLNHQGFLLNKGNGRYQLMI